MCVYIYMLALFLCLLRYFSVLDKAECMAILGLVYSSAPGEQSP